MDDLQRELGDLSLKEESLELHELPQNLLGDDVTVLKREIFGLRECTGPSILTLHGVCIRRNDIAIVTELMSASLADFAYGRRQGELSYTQSMRIALELSRGLQHVHSLGFVHRDVKPENVLLDDQLRPKLGDFGLTTAVLTSIVHTMAPGAGTRHYMSPEQMDDSGEMEVTKATDIYAFGNTVLALLQQAAPWPATMTKLQLLKAVMMSKKKPTIPDTLPEEVKKLIDWCLQWNYKDRPTAAQVTQTLESIVQSQGTESTSEQQADEQTGVLTHDKLYREAISYLYGVQDMNQNVRKGASLMKQAADQGYARAMFEHGQHLLHGLYFTSVDMDAGRQYVTRAAAASASDPILQSLCQLPLGGSSLSPEQPAAAKVLLLGDQTDPWILYCLSQSLDVASSVKQYLQMAADCGHPLAQESISQTSIDAGIARTYLQLAADHGSAGAINTLGTWYRDGKYGLTKNFDQAAEYFKLAAEQAHQQAECNLAVCCENGWGCERNETIAANIYRLLAEKRDAGGQCGLARCYEHGKGVEKDLKKSAQFYQLAANQNLPDAWLGLGICYRDAKGVDRDHKRALELFDKALSAGVLSANYHKGICYANGLGLEKNQNEAIKLYRAGAEQGNPECAHALGICYSVGNGVTKDLSQAVSLFQKAVAAGYAEAQYDLGVMYALGSAVTKDEKKAAELYQQAADQGVARAQHSLGVMYERGIGVPKNAHRAVRNYQLAADQGFALSQLNLGACYAAGSPVPKDERKATELYKRASDQGLAQAQHALAMCYQSGAGVPKDDAQAVQLLHLASVQGYPESQVHLAHCFLYGRGTIKDEKRALHLYQLAAGKENAAALRALGYCHEVGVGSVRDMNGAIHFYRLAATKGDPMAKEDLARLKVPLQ